MTTITGEKTAGELTKYELKTNALMGLSDQEVLDWVNAADVDDIKKALKLLLLGHRELVRQGVI